MNARWLVILLSVCLTGGTVRGEATEAVRLAADPALSPDGETLAFVWRGDIWRVPSAGGVARQLTQHPADDGQPAFSPDGSEIAFVSDRETGNQVFVIALDGGEPKQLTFHTSGYDLEQWYPDGGTLLVSGRRDHFWTANNRFFRVWRHDRRAEEWVFDADGADGALSPDGNQLLFTREGMSWWPARQRRAVAVVEARRRRVLLRRGPKRRVQPLGIRPPDRGVPPVDPFPGRFGGLPVYLPGRLDDRVPPSVRPLSSSSRRGYRSGAN